MSNNAHSLQVELQQSIDEALEFLSSMQRKYDAAKGGENEDYYANKLEMAKTNLHTLEEKLSSLKAPQNQPKPQSIPSNAAASTVSEDKISTVTANTEDTSSEQSSEETQDLLSDSDLLLDAQIDQGQAVSQILQETTPKSRPHTAAIKSDSTAKDMSMTDDSDLLLDAQIDQGQAVSQILQETTPKSRPHTAAIKSDSTAKDMSMTDSADCVVAIADVATDAAHEERASGASQLECASEAAQEERASGADHKDAAADEHFVGRKARAKVVKAHNGRKDLSETRIVGDSVYLQDKKNEHTQMRIKLRHAIAKAIESTGVRLPGRKDLSETRIVGDSVYLQDKKNEHTQMRIKLRHAIAKAIESTGVRLPDWFTLSCRIASLFKTMSVQEIEYTSRTMLCAAWRRKSSSVGVKTAAMRKLFAEDLICTVDSHRLAIRASESVMSKERSKLFVRCKKAIEGGKASSIEAFAAMCREFATDFVHLTEREIVLRCRLQWYQHLVDFAKLTVDRKSLQVEYNKRILKDCGQSKPTVDDFVFTSGNSDDENKAIERGLEKYQKAVRDYIQAAKFHFVPTADEVFDACKHIAPVVADSEKHYICEVMCNRYESQVLQMRNQSFKQNDKNSLRNAIKRLALLTEEKNAIAICEVMCNRYESQVLQMRNQSFKQNDKNSLRNAIKRLALLTEEKNAIAKTLQSFLSRLNTLISSMKSAATEGLALCAPHSMQLDLVCAGSALVDEHLSSLADTEKITLISSMKSAATEGLALCAPHSMQLDLVCAGSALVDEHLSSLADTEKITDSIANYEQTTSSIASQDQMSLAHADSQAVSSNESASVTADTQDTDTAIESSTVAAAKTESVEYQSAQADSGDNSPTDNSTSASASISCSPADKKSDAAEPDIATQELEDKQEFEDAPLFRHAESEAAPIEQGTAAQTEENGAATQAEESGTSTQAEENGAAIQTKEYGTAASSSMQSGERASMPNVAREQNMPEANGERKLGGNNFEGVNAFNVSVQKESEMQSGERASMPNVAREQNMPEANGERKLGGNNFEGVNAFNVSVQKESENMQGERRVAAAKVAPEGEQISLSAGDRMAMGPSYRRRNEGTAQNLSKADFSVAPQMQQALSELYAKELEKQQQMQNPNTQQASSFAHVEDVFSSEDGCNIDTRSILHREHLQVVTNSSSSNVTDHGQASGANGYSQPQYVAVTSNLQNRQPHSSIFAQPVHSQNQSSVFASQGNNQRPNNAFIPNEHAHNEPRSMFGRFNPFHR